MRKKLSLNVIVTGFSLVELLIVISIMAVLFSLGYANYRDFQRRQHLEAAVRMVKADLRLAQEMALAGKKPSLPVGNACETSDLLGYIFERIDISSYRISASCFGGDVTVKNNVGLPLGAQVQVGGGNSFLFRVLGRGVDRNVTITLSFPGSGVANRTITITTAGEIR